MRKIVAKSLFFTFITITCLGSLVTTGFSQDSCYNKSIPIADLVRSFFQSRAAAQSGLHLQKGHSEAFLCLLQVDSNGRIDRINFLSDNRNKDSAYFMLKNLTKDAFEAWQSRACRSKTIILPITVDDYKRQPAYVSVIGNQRIYNPGDHERFVLLSPLNLTGP